MRLLKEHELDLNKKYVIYTKGRYRFNYGYKNLKQLFKDFHIDNLDEIEGTIKCFEVNIKIDGSTFNQRSNKITDLLDIYDFETEDEKKEYLMIEELKK